MKYISVADAAKKWKISERSVRNYCAHGRIADVVLTGKTWNIPADAVKPGRKPKQSKKPHTLLDILQEEQSSKQHGGIYHKIQIDLTYNSNHIEGSQLTHDQTRYIFETNTIGMEDKSAKVDDIVETANHFKCIDKIIENANYKISERFIKELHSLLKNGTSDSRKSWFMVGDYKRQPNEVGGHATTSPEQVAAKMKTLLAKYNRKNKHTFEELLDFHYQFEAIHPFQDGNGRIGRLLLFKECLRNNIVPFIITDKIKMFYYKGLNEWSRNHERLTDTCLAAQDQMKAVLDYFKIFY
ncbi:Fic family protein [Candidatus Avelusimicrobium fimicolum]|uniref:Fic family protein n=1 Tax=Candidatus Avelusimicrobium fimicolum TaxID=3416216 RepID=UPI0015AAF84E